MRILALIVLFWIAAAPQPTLAQTDCGLPSAGEDNWPVSAPESVGLSSAALCPMVAWLHDWQQSNVHAVLVVRHGALVFEHYFPGTDEICGRGLGEVAFRPETRHDRRSVTKSVVALVLGIAIDRGLIKGIDEPVLSFFPEYADLRTPEKDRITLRDLVTMSAGLEWHEDDTPYASEANSQNRMNNAADPYRYALPPAVVAPPGQIWNYNSGSTEVIGAVLKKTTAKPADELARTLLFAPLGAWRPGGCFRERWVAYQ
jgi:CubicO group peptidase (beta-lactamase class C family)